MKNYTPNSFLRALLVALLMAEVLPASAYYSGYDFRVDGLCYKKTSANTVSVTPYDDMHDDFTSFQDSQWAYLISEYKSYVGYPDLNGELIIPESVTQNGNTYTVTSIDWQAFSNCSGLTSVTIPSTVKNRI